MLTYGGAAGSDNVENEGAAAAEASRTSGARLQYWTTDGAHVNGPAFEFEHLDPGSTGPGSMEAWIRACQGLDYFAGATALEGLKTVATIDALYRSAKSGIPEAVGDACE